MRAGYLAALAARTLGVTPVLQPATPSRFEPEGAQAGLREIVEVQEAGPDLPAAPSPPPARADQEQAAAVTEADRPRCGLPEFGFPYEGPAVAGLPDSWPAPDLSELARDPAEAAGHRRRGTPVPARAAADPQPVADNAALPPAGSLPRSARATADVVSEGIRSGGQATSPLSRAAADGGAAAAPPFGPARGRATWHVDVVQTGRSRQQAQADGRAGEAAEASGAEPTIIVRIGRVDVRAVQAESPPLPAPRPRPPAAQSLAEHLLARDRGRR